MGDKPNTFAIRPVPCGTLTYAKASCESVYGKVECGWEKTNVKSVLTVSMPANTEANIILPNGEEHCVASGVHLYEIE